ncbi:NDR1/HIN1-like protein [Ohtaekwangia koreensis]|nr:LEA type 2 family protein [Ohtaekwangia koreensis]
MKHNMFIHPIVRLAFTFLFVALLYGCKTDYEEVQLRQIKDVVVDANTDPRLKANAIFFNPNNKQGRLRKIDVDIYVNGKKAGKIDQKLRTVIPAKGEFTVPLEVQLAMKELGFFDTLLGVLGGKKFEVRYEGSLKLTYHGIPFRVPVKYKDEVRIRF